MSEKENNKTAPRLRFPEFKENEGWKEISLIDVTDKKLKWSFIGGPFGSNLKSSDYVTDGIRIIQLQNIGDGEFIDDYKIFTTEEKADELLSCNIYPGDIIISKMGDPVGRACLIPNTHNRFVMCSDGIRLVVDEQLHSKYFIYSLINSIQFRSLVEKAATGSTRKRIGLDDLRNLPMLVPNNLTEQQKIADCLSSIDDFITAQSEKIEALKAHKKGLIQQLFPAEGEAVPRLRFGEFKNDGEWKEYILGGIAAFLKGKGIAKSDITSSGILPCIRYGELYTYYNEIIKDVVSYTNLSPSDLILSKKNDVIIPSSGETKEDISSASCVQQSGIALGGDLNIIRSQINGEFLSYYLNFAKKHEISKIAQGYSVVHLYPDQLKKLKVIVPTNNLEQQKIAECLSSLDDQIRAQNQKVEALKTHKKGLMQQLFPSASSINE